MKIDDPQRSREIHNMADNNIDEVAQQIEGVRLHDQNQNDNQQFDVPMDADIMGLPNLLIVTNVDTTVYEDEQQKCHFEEVFRQYDSNATIQYLKSFRRARVEYNSPILAAKARIHLHDTEVCGTRIKCYFAQVRSDNTEGSAPHLQPPLPDKQFLISPPASPPVGWEPVHEGQPVINYDLLAALANLAPGESHELHPGASDQPSIIVHLCEDGEGSSGPGKIAQTRCPDRR